MRTRSTALRAVLGGAFLVLTAPFVRADVIVVGPGHVPSTIQAAVDAAQDGDVILVKTGTYPSFVVRNTELAIVADTGADVRIDGAVRVGNLASTRTVVLSGLKSVGAPVSDLDAAFGLRVRNCAGLVFAQDCTFTGAPPANAPLQPVRSSVLVENSAGVVLAHCVIVGGATQPDSLGYSGVGVDGARLTSSSLSLYDTIVGGGAGALGYFDFDGTPGGDAIHATASRVFASGCTFLGGRGGDGAFDGDGGNGGNGVELVSGSSLTDVTCTISGGGPGIRGPDGGPFGGPHDGLPGSALASSASTRTQLSGSARVLDAPTVVREGGVALLTFDGVPNDALTRASSERGVALDVPSAGTQVPGGSARFATLGVLGATGRRAQRVLAPQLGAGVEARTLFFQGLHASSPGVVRLGTPRCVVVLDGAF